MKILALILAFFWSADLAQKPTQKPTAKYISRSAYTTTKMTANKKGFVFGNEMPNSKGKYTFTFYSDHIVLKTDRITSFTIEKIDKRDYPHNVAYFVKNSNGKRNLIVLSPDKNVKNEGNHIDLYEDYRNGIYYRFTMIICKKVEIRKSIKH